MTQEEKQLLIKDLLARLPYGVILRQYSCTKDYYDNSGETIDIPLNELIHPIFERGFLTIRPYLRPMSSITGEERKEFESLGWRIDEIDNNGPWAHCSGIYFIEKGIDWLNAHHFDYRGLIPKGLAIEVTKKNNPYEN